MNFDPILFSDAIIGTIEVSTKPCWKKFRQIFFEFQKIIEIEPDVDLNAIFG